MKLLYVCGSYPPEKDSFADTAKIAVELFQKKGLEVEVLSNVDWRISNWLKIRRIVKDSGADIIHMQYPSMGFKYRISPLLLPFINRRKTIVTIHEVSQFHLLRKLMLLPFSFCAHLAFTNAYEKFFF